LIELVVNADLLLLELHALRLRIVAQRLLVWMAVEAQLVLSEQHAAGNCSTWVQGSIPGLCFFIPHPLHAGLVATPGHVKMDRAHYLSSW
jgi:hypothetical protein